MRVLIAEDEPVIRRLLEATLLQWGYEVTVACDGEEAWRLLQAGDSPPLAILDWMMPGIDGMEVCRRVRAMPGPKLTYLILLTAQGRTENVVAGLNAGADDYITKPFNREELRARVRVGARMLELQATLAERIKELAVAQALVIERERFGAAVSAMSDGILVTDGAWRITTANHAACLLLNAPDSWEGLPLDRLLEPFTLSMPLEQLHGSSAREESLEIARLNTSPPLYLDGRLTRLFDGAGRLAGAVLTVRDVTEARHAQNLRTNFFTLVSHKLCTPLTVMSTYLHLIDRMPPERRAERLDRMLEVLGGEIERLEAHVKTLLEFKELTREELQLVSRRTEVTGALAAAGARVRSGFPDRELEIVAEVAPDAGYAADDAAHLELVLTKLLDNAVKFGDKRPVSIRVKVERRSPGWLNIAVADNGPGIPHEYFDRVLEGFMQVEDHVTGQVPGMGMGLLLVKRVVESYGGKVSIQSRLGEGTTFSFTFPALDG